MRDLGLLLLLLLLLAWWCLWWAPRLLLPLYWLLRGGWLCVDATVCRYRFVNEGAAGGRGTDTVSRRCHRTW